MRNSMFCVLAAMAPLAAACKDGPTGPVDANEWVVPAAGATIETHDGRVRLIIPAGAVPAATTITIRPVDSSDQDSAVVPGSVYRFQPAGLVFAQPVELTIRYDRARLPNAELEPYLWLHKRVGSGWEPMAGELVDAEAGQVRGTITGFSDFGAAVASVARALEELHFHLVTMLNEATGSTAIQFATALAALYQEIDAPFYQQMVGPLLEFVERQACQAYTHAVAAARLRTVTSYGAFRETLQPVIAWAGVVVNVGVLEGCPTAADFDAVLEAKFEDFLGFMVSRVSGPDFTPDFNLLVAEARDLAAMRADAALVGLTEVEEALRTAVQHPVMDRMRAAAYRVCREGGRQYYLGELRLLVSAQDGAEYGEPDLLVDLQQCATQLDWKVLDGAPAELGAGRLGGSDEPGVVADEATSAARGEGALVLEGALRAFQCQDGSYDTSDELVVRVNGLPVATRRHDGGFFFATPLVLDLAEVWDAAGVDTGQDGTHVLRIARASLGCSGMYVADAGAEFVLGELRLELSGAEPEEGWTLERVGVSANRLLPIDDPNRCSESQTRVLNERPAGHTVSASCPTVSISVRIDSPNEQTVTIDVAAAATQGRVHVTALDLLLHVRRAGRLRLEFEESWLQEFIGTFSGSAHAWATAPSPQPQARYAFGRPSDRIYTVEYELPAGAAVRVHLTLSQLGCETFATNCSVRGEGRLLTVTWVPDE